MKIGFWELIVIVIVAFVFIGPDQLPVYAKKIGKMLRELKKYTGAASEEIQKNVVEPLNEIQAPLKEAVAPLTDIKKDIDSSMRDVTKSFTGIGKTSKEEAAKKQAETEEVTDLTEDAVEELPEQPAEAMGPILGAAAETNTVIITPEMDDIRLLRGKRLENRIDYGGYKANLQFPGAHQANHAAMAVEIALALWREFGYDISDDAIEQGLNNARMPARIEVMRRHPLLLLDGCHNPDGAKMLAATLTRADFEENLVGVLGVLADKDYKDMLSDLAPCFAKVYTVTPNCPRALSAEDLQKEARFHTEAEAADSVADAIRKAVDFADENNLAGVVVCGSLYLAAEARPILLKEAEK